MDGVELPRIMVRKSCQNVLDFSAQITSNRTTILHLNFLNKFWAFEVRIRLQRSDLPACPCLSGEQSLVCSCFDTL